MNIRLYIDCALPSTIARLMKTGVFCGVTTNPLILRQAGVHVAQLAQLIERTLDLGAGEVFVQSWGEDGDMLCTHGRLLADVSSKVVVKVPATREGFEAAGRLASEGIKICITAVYTPFQAVLAASVGAAYLAPYLGRMNDAGRDGHAMIAQMSEALRNTASSSRILAASIRSPEDVATLARNGVRCMTVSPAVAEALFEEPLTIAAVRAFETAAKEIAR